MVEDRLRKWVFVALAVLFAIQLYFVQELVAALLLFGAVFLVFAILASLIILLQKGSRRGLMWIESRLPSAFANSRRAMAFAVVLSKTTFHRPHSRPAP
jgi:hypothetical protein